MAHKKGSFCCTMQEQLKALGRETWLTSWELIRIAVPVAVATKVLQEFGLIGYLSALLAPVMGLIGLPGSLGLVWATAMLTNIYGGIAVFAAIAPGLALTGAQITVLCSAMLIAHSLPIELSVSKRAGANLLPITILRVCGAIVYAFILNRFCLSLDLWQEKSPMLFTASAGAENFWQWGLGLLQNQGLIVVIICCIIICMRVLRGLGILFLLEKALTPILPFFGMSRKAASLTVVGMIMGIGYGGALIIRETSTGELAPEEVFHAMALLGLCHGLVEDTLLMAAIGGRFGGILWGRIIFALIVVFFMARLLQALAAKRLSSPM